MTKPLTNKQKQQLQEASVFAVLSRLGVATAEEIADESGDPETDTFCTTGKASAALRMFEKLGLVEDAGPDPTIKRSRRSLKRWELSFYGNAIVDAILREEGE